MTGNYPADRPAPAWRFPAIIIIVALLHLALRGLYLHEPFERDEGFYAVIASIVLDGGMPYRDAVDLKPPGVFLIYALFIGLGGETVEAVRAGTALWSAATLGLLAVLMRRRFGESAAVVGALLFAVFAAAPMYQADAANTEIFLGLPLLLWYGALSAHLARPRPAALGLAGLGLALALTIKTVVLPFALLTVTLVAWRALAQRGARLRRAATELAALAAAPMAVLAMLCAWFALRGAWDAFVHWNVAVPLSYVTQGFVGGPSLAYSLSRHWVEVAPFMLPALVYAVVRLFRPHGRALDAANLLSLALLASIAAFLLPGKNLPHYYVLWVPFGCMLAGVAGGHLLAMQKAPRLAVGACWLGLLGLYLALRGAWYIDATEPGAATRRKYDSDLFGVTDAAGRHIASRTAPGETIFQWGFEPQLYFVSGRRPSSRYIASIMPVIEGDFPQARRRLENDLRQRPPRYIVLAENTMRVPGLEVVEAYLRSQPYAFERDFPYHDDGVPYRLRLYRRML